MSSHGRVTRQRTFPPFTSLLRPNALSGKKDVDSVSLAIMSISDGGMINYGGIDPAEMHRNKDTVRKILQKPENRPFLRRLKESHISIFQAMAKSPDTLWKNLIGVLSTDLFGYPRVQKRCFEILNPVSL